jgi:hypothetical protein
MVRRRGPTIIRIVTDLINYRHGPQSIVLCPLIFCLHFVAAESNMVVQEDCRLIEVTLELYCCLITEPFPPINNRGQWVRLQGYKLFPSTSQCITQDKGPCGCGGFKTSSPLENRVRVFSVPCTGKYMPARIESTTKKNTRNCKSS